MRGGLSKYHWKVGKGTPEAAVVKATLVPAVTVVLAGCCVKTGGGGLSFPNDGAVRDVEVVGGVEGESFRAMKAGGGA